MPIRPTETPSEYNESPRGCPIDPAMESFRQILGDPPTGESEKMTQEELFQRQRIILNDFSFDTYQELQEYNSLVCANNKQQRLKDKPDNTDETAEAVVVNQALTYHQYFPKVINYVFSTMAKYQARRADAPQSVIRKLAINEKFAQLYLDGLVGALQEKVSFENIRALQYLLSDDNKTGVGPSGDKLTEQDKFFIRAKLLRLEANSSLSGESKIVLSRNNSREMKIQINKLNQRIIDILAGDGRIAGVPKGFMPQQLYLELLTGEYEFLLEEQTKYVRDSDGTAIESQLMRLDAKEEIQDGLSKEDLNKYERLQRAAKDRNKEIQKMSVKRKNIMEEILGHTDTLGTYQAQVARLTTLQHQFGAMEDPNASGEIAPSTIPELREAIGRNVEQRSDYHLDRLDSFSKVFGEKVLHIGISERVEDFSVRKLRPLYLDLANGIASVVTLVIPDVVGLKARVRKAFTGDLAESMGWPMENGRPMDMDDFDENLAELQGKDERGELKRAEKDKYDKMKIQKQKLIDRMKTIKGAITDFKKEKLSNFRGTISAIRAMPKASTFLNQPVNNIPTERITTDNLQAMIDKHGGAAVYFALFNQLEEDWGDHEKNPPTGLIGEVDTFFKKVDINITAHINTARSLNDLKELMGDFTKWIIIALCAGAAVGSFVTVVVMVGGKFVLRKIAVTALSAGKGAIITGSGAIITTAKAAAPTLGKVALVAANYIVPVAVAATAGAYVYDKADSATQDWSREWDDWMRDLTPGESLEKLKAMGPGKRSKGHGYGKGTIAEQLARKIFTSRKSYERWTERGESTIKGANQRSRHNISKAYIVRTTGDNLPPDVDESPQDYQKRFDQYAIDQMQYLGVSSQETYSYQISEGYQWGREYAHLMARSRALKASGGSEKFSWIEPEENKEYTFDIRDFESLPWNDKGGQLGKRMILSRFIMLKKRGAAPVLNSMMERESMTTQTRKRTFRQFLINQNYDGFYRLDGRISSADFKGVDVWGVSSGETTGRTLARYTAYRLIREELEKQTNNLISKADSNSITQNDVQSANISIGAIVDKQDVLWFQHVGTERGYEKLYVVKHPERAAKLLSARYFINGRNR